MLSAGENLWDASLDIEECVRQHIAEIEQTPNSHFTYRIRVGTSLGKDISYNIRAFRNTRELSVEDPGGALDFWIGGTHVFLPHDDHSSIVLYKTDVANPTGPDVQIFGTGLYEGMRW